MKLFFWNVSRKQINVEKANLSIFMTHNVDLINVKTSAGPLIQQ